MKVDTSHILAGMTFVMMCKGSASIVSLTGMWDVDLWRMTMRVRVTMVVSVVVMMSDKLEANQIDNQSHCRDDQQLLYSLQFYPIKYSFYTPVHEFHTNKHQENAVA